jgi:hypothetical protein
VGPGTAKVGNQAEIKVPEGARFTDAAGTRKMLEMMHNPTGGSELGLLTNDQLDWFVIFEFEDIGYVKDADREKLDGQAMLESLREGNEAGNEERKKRGWAPITIVGWHTAPFYNKETNNLEWCIKGASEGHDIVNYNIRILGRGGVMSANLLVAPEQLDATLPVIKTMLKGFSYSEGQKYSEWKSGDKIAKYGLSAWWWAAPWAWPPSWACWASSRPAWASCGSSSSWGSSAWVPALKGLIFGKKKEPPAPVADSLRSSWRSLERTRRALRALSDSLPVRVPGVGSTPDRGILRFAGRWRGRNAFRPNASWSVVGGVRQALAAAVPALACRAFALRPRSQWHHANRIRQAPDRPGKIWGQCRRAGTAWKAAIFSRYRRLPSRRGRTGRDAGKDAHLAREEARGRACASSSMPASIWTRPSTGRRNSRQERSRPARLFQCALAWAYSADWAWRCSRTACWCCSSPPPCRCCLWPINSVVFYFTVRRLATTWLPRAQGPDLSKRLVAMLSPISGVRGVDMLAREVWANLDPMTVAAALLSPQDLPIRAPVRGGHASARRRRPCLVARGNPPAHGARSLQEERRHGCHVFPAQARRRPRGNLLPLLPGPVRIRSQGRRALSQRNLPGCSSACL